MGSQSDLTLFFFVFPVKNTPFTGFFGILIPCTFVGIKLVEMSGNVYLFLIGLSLVCSIGYLLKAKNNKMQGHSIILGILIFVLIFESLGSYTASLKINNSLLYNVCWVYLESLLLILYFYQSEKSGPFKKKIIYAVSILFGWGIVNSVFFQPIATGFQFYSFLPNTLFILFLCVRFLLQLLNLQIFKDWNLIAVPHFWISTAILFFYVEALLVFGLYQFSPELVIDNVAIFFGFNRMMAALMYLIFGFSFYFPSISKKIGNPGNNIALL